MIDPTALGLDVFGIKNDEAIVLCPFHDDHKPTNAQFNVTKGLFYCFACGRRANAKQIARFLGGSLETLSDTILITKAKEDREWRHLLYAPLAIGHPYLEARGIPEDLIRDCRILEISDGFIGIPVYEAGGEIPVGLNLRRVPSNYTSTGLHRRTNRSMGWLYNTTARYIHLGVKPPISLLSPDTGHDAFLYNKQPIIVEGIFGALRARRLGIRAYPVLGAGVSYRTLVSLNGREPRIIFDDDFAGYLGAAKILMHSPNGMALCPGLDFDTIDNLEDYSRALATRYYSREFYTLGELSGNSEAFFSALSKSSLAR